MSGRLAVMTILLLASCSQTPVGDTVVLDEFSVVLPAMERGVTELSVRNDGEFPHTLVISDAAGQVVVATELIDPGGEFDVPVDLDSGRYQFSCRIVVETPDGGISDHFELGMVDELDL